MIVKHITTGVIENREELSRTVLSENLENEVEILVLNTATDEEIVNYGYYRVEINKVDITYYSYTESEEIVNNVCIITRVPTALPNVDIEKRVEKALMDMIDEHRDNIEISLLGVRATPKQIRAYEIKYKKALVGRYSAEKNALIIGEYEGFMILYDNKDIIIEDFREKVKDVYFMVNDYNNASLVIQEGVKLDITKSDENLQIDIDTIFSLYVIGS